MIVFVECGDMVYSLAFRACYCCGVHALVLGGMSNRTCRDDIGRLRVILKQATAADHCSVVCDGGCHCSGYWLLFERRRYHDEGERYIRHHTLQRTNMWLASDAVGFCYSVV